MRTGVLGVAHQITKLKNLSHVSRENAIIIFVEAAAVMFATVQGHVANGSPDSYQ